MQRNACYQTLRGSRPRATGKRLVCSSLPADFWCWHDVGPVLASTGPMSCQHQMFAGSWSIAWHVTLQEGLKMANKDEKLARCSCLEATSCHNKSVHPLKGQVCDRLPVLTLVDRVSRRRWATFLFRCLPGWQFLPLFGHPVVTSACTNMEGGGSEAAAIFPSHAPRSVCG